MSSVKSREHPIEFTAVAVCLGFFFFKQLLKSMKHSEVESRSCPFFLSGTSTVCGSFQQDVLARVILGLSCVLSLPAY